MAKKKRHQRQSLKSQPLATKAGPAGWLLDAKPDDSDERRQKAMEIELGQQLIDMSRWVGLRASIGDKRSIKILADHVIMILQTGKEIIERNDLAKKN